MCGHEVIRHEAREQWEIVVRGTSLKSRAGFTLDTLGVAGVFGGDEAVSVMATVHVYENRRAV